MGQLSVAYQQFCTEHKLGLTSLGMENTIIIILIALQDIHHDLYHGLC